MRPSDTSPAVWKYVEDRIRALSPEQRIHKALSLTIMTHRIALAQIAKDYPDEDRRTHQLRLAARYYPEDLMKRAFNWPHDGR
jgi:hypothetical protein